jgi:hypothetical protein
MDRIYTNFHQNGSKLHLFSATEALIHKNSLELFVKTTAKQAAAEVKQQQRAIGPSHLATAAPSFVAKYCHLP